VLRRPVEFTQYVSIRYTERLLEAGIEPSVGSVGDSYDNALAETINGLFKAELIHRRGPWRSASRSCSGCSRAIRMRCGRSGCSPCRVPRPSPHLRWDHSRPDVKM